MTNKLVVIINIFKVPKIKKISLYEIKFLVPNYGCLTRRLQPSDPRSLCPQLNLLDPTPEQNSWVRHWPKIMFTVEQAMKAERGSRHVVLPFL